MQLSWEKALGVFDTRLVDVPLEKGVKLRHWRETVAAVYSDFEAKLPDAKPPVLILRARWVDGRIEGSRYPNLMFPEMRQQCGI